MKTTETLPSTEPVMTKALEAPQPSDRRRFLQWALGSALLCCGTGVYSSRIEPEELVVARLDVSLKGWPSAAEGLRVGHMSDLHCDCDRATARTSRAVRLLLDQQPDVVFLTGDYVTLDSSLWAPKCADLLAPLAQVKYGVYAILGNHDWWAGDPDGVAHHLRRVGFTVLRNQAAPMPGVPGAWIVGLDDRHVNRQDANRALRGVPAEALKLLLIHEPDYADEAPMGFALQLSGHSHGGQIRLPGLPPLLTPQYAKTYPEGLQRARKHLVYTTRGVGLINIMARLFCPPEVAVLTLHSDLS